MTPKELLESTQAKFEATANEAIISIARLILVRLDHKSVKEAKILVKNIHEAERVISTHSKT